VMFSRLSQIWIKISMALDLVTRCCGCW
jgi:hypothetical protein